jgi:hypothetical protein
MRRTHIEKEIPSIVVYIRSELIMVRDATIVVTECNSLSFPYVRALSLCLFLSFSHIHIEVDRRNSPRIRWMRPSLLPFCYSYSTRFFLFARLREIYCIFFFFFFFFAFLFRSRCSGSAVCLPH